MQILTETDLALHRNGRLQMAPIWQCKRQKLEFQLPARRTKMGVIARPATLLRLVQQTHAVHCPHAWPTSRGTAIGGCDLSKLSARLNRHASPLPPIRTSRVAGPIVWLAGSMRPGNCGMTSSTHPIMAACRSTEHLPTHELVYPPSCCFPPLLPSTLVLACHWISCCPNVRLLTFNTIGLVHQR